MSKWTHICGLIRLDRLYPLVNPTIAQVETIFKRNIPKGSEGALDFSVYELREPLSSILWCIVALHGDLRDFGYGKDVERVINWFKDSCRACEEELKCSIRQAIVQIHVEAQKQIILFLSDFQEWKQIEFEAKY